MKFKKIFVFFLIISSFGGLRAQEEQNAMMKACDNLDKLASIAGAITYMPWQSIMYTPSGPVPGILIAAIQPESALLDFCSMYQHMKLLRGAELGMEVLKNGNELTGKKFDDHYVMLANTYDLGTSVDNLKRVDGDALTKARVLAPQLNAWLGSANEYYNKQTDSESETFTSRNERESKMNQLIASAANISLIQDISSCPEKKTNNTESFSIDTASKVEELNYLRGDIDFLTGALKKMGIKMSSDSSNFKKYLEELYSFFESYAQYSVAVRSYTKETVVMEEIKGKVAKDKPKTREIKKNIKSEYQVFSVTLDENVFEAFSKKWSNNWSDVLKANTFTETRGVLMTKQGGVIEDEFRDLYFECRDSLIYRKTKEAKPEYFVNLDDSRRDASIAEAREICITEQRKALKNVPNLFTYYVEQAKETIERTKKLQGDIWTVDSYYNGTVRVIDRGQVKNSEGKITTKEQVSCSDKLNATELQTVQNKASAEMTKVRSLLAEENVKKTSLLKAKENRFKRKIEEQITKDSINTEKLRRTETVDPNFKNDSKRGI